MEKACSRNRKDKTHLEPTPENITRVRAFVLRKWQERAKETPETILPTDLSGSCKFSSLFASKIFGGEIQGNPHHQFVRVNEQILDLNADALDVKKMQQTKNPYYHDSNFFGNPEHQDSMRSCEARVNRWILEFFQDPP